MADKSDREDIVIRLRSRRITNWAHSTGCSPRANGFLVDPECDEAATEIEKLRAWIEKAFQAHPNIDLDIEVL